MEKLSYKTYVALAAILGGLIAPVFGICSKKMILLSMIGSTPLGVPALSTLFVLGKLLGIAGFVGFPFIGAWYLGIPSLGAALTSQAANTGGFFDFFLRVIIPTGSMIIFALHPSVGLGVLFATYWLIPIGCWAADKQWGTCAVRSALSGSFVAHALGAVFFLHTHSSSPALWLALIPAVLLERLIIASVLYAGQQLATIYGQKKWAAAINPQPTKI